MFGTNDRPIDLDHNTAPRARVGPLRILLISTEAPPVVSGVAQVVGQLSDRLRNAGHDVDHLSGDEFGRLTVGELRLSGLALKWRALANRLGDYDVVNLHGPAPTMCDAYLALHRMTRASRRPALVYTHHFDVDFDGASWACQTYGRLFNRLLRASDHVITTTDTYAHLLSQRVHCPITVAPLGVDPQRCSTLGRVATASPTPLRVLFLGQLRRYKGLDTLLTAARMTPHVTVTIGGSGPLADYVKRRIAHERLRNVTVIPYVDDDRLAALYARHDVIVLPSKNRQEAFGLVLLEGMAAGLVPVASALPGVADVAQLTGLTFAPGDAQALCALLERLDTNRDDLQQRSARGPIVARRFKWSAMSSTYEHVLREAVVTHACAGAPPPDSGPRGTEPLMQANSRLPQPTVRVDSSAIG